MENIVNPGHEALKILLEAADFAREGKNIEASTLAGISANLAEYGFVEYDLNDPSPN